MCLNPQCWGIPKTPIVNYQCQTQNYVSNKIEYFFQSCLAAITKYRRQRGLNYRNLRFTVLGAGFQHAQILLTALLLASRQSAVLLSRHPAISLLFLGACTLRKRKLSGISFTRTLIPSDQVLILVTLVTSSNALLPPSPISKPLGSQGFNIQQRWDAILRKWWDTIFQTFSS